MTLHPPQVCTLCHSALPVLSKSPSNGTLKVIQWLHWPQFDALSFFPSKPQANNENILIIPSRQTWIPPPPSASSGTAWAPATASSHSHSLYLRHRVNHSKPTGIATRQWNYASPAPHRPSSYLHGPSLRFVPLPHLYLHLKPEDRYP